MAQITHLKPEGTDASEPPSRCSLLFIGQNKRGCWVVRDQSGMLGGLFVSRAEAFRFAMFETGHCLQAIVMAPGMLELDMSGSKMAAANDSKSSQPLAHSIPGE